MLRYYDYKELLKPSFPNKHGYRFYIERDIMVLQNVLTLKYLDYSPESHPFV
ncbi:MerR family transcriptional regulator [Paenibacillus sinopodophylli]|uniref:MerR family transcriptional regulator n=1 Tax=Paenibacillus sinopodophylli TaxID=1837342 RepID=UPI00110C96FC